MIGKCEPIENCQTSSWFNNCSKCQKNHSFTILKGGTF